MGLLGMHLEGLQDGKAAPSPRLACMGVGGQRSGLRTAISVHSLAIGLASYKLAPRQQTGNWLLARQAIGCSGLGPRPEALRPAQDEDLRPCGLARTGSSWRI